MSGLIQKLRKRKCYPVEIGGETIHVRPLTLGELSAMSAFTDERLTAGFYFGCSLVDDSGTPAFTKADGESNETFAARVADCLADVPADTLAAIRAGIDAASRVPAHDKLKKS